MEANQIKSNIRISDVIGQYVTLKKIGSNYVALCPFHSENSPSLQVNDAKGIFKCFGCGEGGDAIDFVQKIENIGYVAAVAKLSGGDVPNHSTPLPAKQQKPVFAIPEARLLSRYNADYRESTLYQFFTSLFPQHMDIVDKVFTDYRVMAGENGLNVFPNIDINGSIRQVKELTADPYTGKRSHEISPRINGISFLSPEEKENNQLRQCLFGEHLLGRYPDKDAIVCESEKAAIGMTIYGLITDPDDNDLWLATGGKNGVRMSDLKAILPLKERNVYLMPDNDAVSEWWAYVEPISKVAAGCHYIDSIANKENSAEKAKFDVWDYTLEEITAARQNTDFKQDFIREFTARPLSEAEQDAVWAKYKELLPMAELEKAINEILDKGIYEI